MLFIAIVILAISLGWMGWMLGGVRIARQESAPNAPVWDLGPTWAGQRAIARATRRRTDRRRPRVDDYP
ncbi:MAG: hypothetical protein C7B47_17940 [Sulfobacillus thermosulfidooxidans]|uniref:Uncharacterized protein n=1 Tax=Sulfobacillus thermosulfidooxidans TaxID=28034 RepID=A0A2T2WE54_SULTH|nr:MAG: hypothetical protein C7B47_17940 [Sulfobacillus thermosulfidooxidans]